MSRVRFTSQLLYPKYWLTWFGFGVWYATSLLPYSLQMTLGKGLGGLFFRLVKRRRAIALRNVELGFPDKTQHERVELVKGVMASTGMAFFETGMAWFWSKRRLDGIYTIEGVEHLEQAQTEGVGVILMAFHFTHIDIGAKLLGRRVSIDGTYRPHNNPVYDWVQQGGRERHSKGGTAIPRGDVRAMVKALRAGRTIWYAPDQDYGANHSIFVPFFGVEAATVTATSQLARLGKARVIPFTQTRKPDGSGYHLVVYPPFSDFPSKDEVADTLRINQFVEARILEQPEQYLWVHRRFKTRPEGSENLYADITKRRH